MTYYDELKALCKKYGLHCGVYVKSVNDDNTAKHQVIVITDEDMPNQSDIGMTMETIMYFVNALYMAAKDKFYATHIILDLISEVIKSHKDEVTDEH